MTTFLLYILEQLQMLLVAGSGVLCYFPILGAMGGAGGAGAMGAAAGKAGAASGAAGGGAGSMLGKMGGGGGGGGGKQGGGGGGMFSSLLNAGNKPLKATLGIATGMLQSLQAMKLKKKADAAFPDLVDANQAGYLAEINQKKRSIETGADFAEGMKAIDQTNAGTNDALVRASGGDVGATMQGILQAQAGAGQAKNNVLAQGQQQQFNYESAAGQLQNLIAMRKATLQLEKSRQARAEWSAKSAAAGANFMQGVTSLAPGGNSANQPSINAQTAAPVDTNPMAGKPTLPAQQTMETTGVQSPTVVPAKPLSNPNMGSLIQLKQ
jgi:hypothetical protein